MPHKHSVNRIHVLREERKQF